VRALDRKLLRDLVHLRGQVLAIALVVACGVATVVTTRTAYDSLVSARADYYARYRFADVFAHLSPMQKEAIILRLRELGHVVGFLGDGINDAPALTAATVGIAFGQNSDITGEPITHHPCSRFMQYREFVERSLGTEFLDYADEGVGHQHDPEQSILRVSSGQDHNKKRSEDQVEAGEDVRPEDLAKRPACTLSGVVRLTASCS